MEQSRALTTLDNTSKRIGARLIEGLCRLGFEHQTQDGRKFYPTFCDRVLVGTSWALYQIDAERLYHTPIVKLMTPDVAAHLSACAHRPVKPLHVQRSVPGLLEAGYYYVVEMCPKPPAARLPHSVPLDLAQRPAGEYVIGFGLGRDGLVWRELAKLTHIIVAGSSDSGKSAFLRSLVYQLAQQRLPVELYLADLEGLTFAWAENWQMLKMPIAQDVNAATELTDKLLAEVDRRAQLYFATGKFPESLAEYHKYSDDRPSEGRLPWIVAIFDEFSALVEEAGKGSEFVRNISQLAMRARKFGVTLVFAGQDFKADLLNTRITNQLKTRVQFRCARREQSAVVLGQGGAEAITVQGRALVCLDGDVIECQTFWVDKAMVISAAPEAQHQGPTMSEFERELVKYAWAELGGGFVINRLAEQFHKGKGGLAALAGRWERQGWLTPQMSRSDPRRVTNTLLGLAGLLPAEVGAQAGRERTV